MSPGAARHAGLSTPAVRRRAQRRWRSSVPRPGFGMQGPDASSAPGLDEDPGPLPSDPTCRPARSGNCSCCPSRSTRSQTIGFSPLSRPSTSTGCLRGPGARCRAGLGRHPLARRAAAPRRRPRARTRPRASLSWTGQPRPSARPRKSGSCNSSSRDRSVNVTITENRIEPTDRYDAAVLDLTGGGAWTWSQIPPRRVARRQRKKMVKEKWVYLFSEGDATMRELLRWQGCELGPDDTHRRPGTAGVQRHYPGLQFLPRGGWFSAGNVGTRTCCTQGIGAGPAGKKFGDPKDPLLVSRAGRGPSFLCPG